MDLEHKKEEYDYLDYNFIVINTNPISINLQSYECHSLDLVQVSVIVGNASAINPLTSNFGFLKLNCTSHGDGLDQLGRKNGTFAIIPMTSTGVSGSTYWSIYTSKGTELSNCLELPGQTNFVNFQLCDETDTPLQLTFKIALNFHVNHIKKY